MSQLEIRALVKRFGTVPAVGGADLTVPTGTLTAVLGPSGCGKTTLLRCVAGFERVDAGTVEIGGRVVAGAGRHVPPHRRQVAIVPQEGALFPHLSVARNVAYGLRRAARHGDRVREVLALVGLTGYEDRMPHQLSGGQQQRVAVARALAPRPSLILLDEPFSALDATLRSAVRDDVRTALHADRATAVLVTHDQAEALSMADQVAVMRSGAIVQTATPVEVYRAPADAWTAGFVGEAVLLTGTLSAGGVATPLGVLPLARQLPEDRGPVRVMVRPEQITLSRDDDGTAAVVDRVDFHGHDALLNLRLDGGLPVTARVLAGAALPLVGDEVRLRVQGTALGWTHETSVAPTAPRAAIRS
ncbi:ABC transporter ATP-binding protein [Micromonospora sp. WMMD1082]|uniref:ABC transporter ATP-binding protein n=1 Tax=Micromonospora sp. WMMD1082 TaxID=3016104 RepID=UPI002417FBC0|nr:ABC transporter ATP-binding protein [Micromonospora sp. WMMD1082]MDG4797355.1 ABC transporter ATP-binding protein [Micromonospora sp. WMMD1082]